MLVLRPFYQQQSTWHSGIKVKDIVCIFMKKVVCGKGHKWGMCPIVESTGLSTYEYECGIHVHNIFLKQYVYNASTLQNENFCELPVGSTSREG